MIKVDGNKLIIELKTSGEEHPVDVFLRLRYQIMHLLNNQDEDARIKCFEVIQFLEQTTPIDIEELTRLFNEINHVKPRNLVCQ